MHGGLGEECVRGRGAAETLLPDSLGGRSPRVSGCCVEKSSNARVPQRGVVACLGGTRRRREVRGAGNERSMALRIDS